MEKMSISYSLINAKLSKNVAQLRAQINDVSSEAVTGKRADLSKFLSGRIGEAMLSQKALEDIQVDRGALQLRDARIDIAQRSLQSAQEGSEGLPARLLAALGVDNKSDVKIIGRDAVSALEKLFSSLNNRHGQRFLFAGDATSTQPFEDPSQLISDVRQMAVTATDAADLQTQLDTYFNTPAGGWQANIYQGSSSITDPDAVNGIDPAITELVRGLAVMAVAGDDTPPALLTQDNAALRIAADTVASGQINMIQLRSRLGVIQERLTEGQDALNSEELILTEAFTNMTMRDQYEAATILKELENNLEASYMLTARLSGLSLLNYLK